MQTLPKAVVLHVGIAVLMLVGWLAQRPAGQISAVTDILFPLAIGLVTYLGGRREGGIWLLVPLARLVVRRFDVDAVVSAVECTLLYAFTSFVIAREIRSGVVRDQLSALIAAMEDVVLVLDSAGNYREVAASPGLVRPLDELVGRNLTAVFSPAEAAFFLAKIQESLTTQKTVTVDYTIDIDGLPRSFSAAVSPMPGETVVWVARDVTRNKANEEALHRLNLELEQRIEERTRELAATIDVLHAKEAARIKAIAALTESQERFELVAQATNDVFWDWDVATDHLFWFTDAYKVRFGGEPPQVGGWLERIHPEDRDRVAYRLEEALRTPSVTFNVEYRFAREDGSYAHILDRAHVVRDETGRPRRMVGVMIDLSDYHRLLKRLEQEKRISGLGRIAATIAHEFNNLTMAIQSNLEVVRRLAVPKMEAPLNHVFTAINRSKRITDQILRYTRPTPPETRTVSVKRLLEDWKKEISATLPSSVELSATVADPTLSIEVDALQVTQVFTNLALNAKDAMLPDGGRLAVEAFAESDRQSDGKRRAMIHFRISDTGCGMSPEQLTSAFEPLFTTKRQGTGLGLAVSQQIATQHGGYLYAESTHGLGAVFHLLLPAAYGVEVEPCANDEPTMPCQRVLLVEDDPSVAAGLTVLLESSGVDVTVCHEGQSALATVMTLNPDCVILDIGLPDMHGTEVFDRIRAKFPTLPIVFSSGHADASKLELYLDLPRVALLVKPYTYADLIATLSAL